jgi:hypothetical protein
LFLCFKLDATKKEEDLTDQLMVAKLNLENEIKKNTSIQSEVDKNLEVKKKQSLVLKNLKEMSFAYKVKYDESKNLF